MALGASLVADAKRSPRLSPEERRRFRVAADEDPLQVEIDGSRVVDGTVEGLDGRPQRDRRVEELPLDVS